MAVARASFSRIGASVVYNDHRCSMRFTDNNLQTIINHRFLRNFHLRATQEPQIFYPLRTHRIPYNLPIYVDCSK